MFNWSKQNGLRDVQRACLFTFFGGASSPYMQRSVDKTEAKLLLNPPLLKTVLLNLDLLKEN